MMNKDGIAIEYESFNENLLLLEQCFCLNGSESPHGTLKDNRQKRFVILSALERYYTSYDTVKAPS